LCVTTMGAVDSFIIQGKCTWFNKWCNCIWPPMFTATTGEV